MSKISLAGKMMNGGGNAAELPTPIKSTSKSKKKPATNGAAAGDASGEEKAFEVLNPPRGGIPLDSSGRDTKVTVVKVLYEPNKRKVYDWDEIKGLAGNFSPPLKDVCRLVVCNKNSNTRHFMMAVRTHPSPTNLVNGKVYEGALYHPLNLKCELSLLTSRTFNNGVRFTNESGALERVAEYGNRLPVLPELAEEGFISDHLLPKKLPTRFNSFDCFSQSDRLLFKEKYPYCPSDKMSQLFPERAESLVFDELEHDDGGEAEADDEDPVDDMPPDEGDGRDVVDEAGVWIERLPAKKQKQPEPKPPTKKKVTLASPSQKKKPARELAEDPVEDDQGDTPKGPLVVKKLTMVKNSNPAPEETAAAKSTTPKAPAKRAPKTVSRSGKISFFCTLLWIARSIDCFARAF